MHDTHVPYVQGGEVKMLKPQCYLNVTISEVCLVGHMRACMPTKVMLVIRAHMLCPCRSCRVLDVARRVLRCIQTTCRLYIEDVHGNVAYVLNEVLLIVLGLGGGVVGLNEGVGVHEDSSD